MLLLNSISPTKSLFKIGKNTENAALILNNVIFYETQIFILQFCFFIVYLQQKKQL